MSQSRTTFNEIGQVILCTISIEAAAVRKGKAAIVTEREEENYERKYGNRTDQGS